MTQFNKDCWFITVTVVWFLLAILFMVFGSATEACAVEFIGIIVGIYIKVFC